MKFTRLLPLLAASFLASSAVYAADPVKIGFITTLSGSAGYLGQDVRDGFELAVKMGKGTLGDVPVNVLVEDDAMKPANGRQIADRFMNDEGVKLFTGLVFSNVAGATVPEILDGGGIFVSPNAGPSEFGGKGCDANYYVISYLTDTMQGSAEMRRIWAINVLFCWRLTFRPVKTRLRVSNAILRARLPVRFIRA